MYLHELKVIKEFLDNGQLVDALMRASQDGYIYSSHDKYFVHDWDDKGVPLSGGFTCTTPLEAAYYMYGNLTWFLTPAI